MEPCRGEGRADWLNAPARDSPDGVRSDGLRVLSARQRSLKIGIGVADGRCASQVGGRREQVPELTVLTPDPVAAPDDSLGRLQGAFRAPAEGQRCLPDFR